MAQWLETFQSVVVAEAITVSDITELLQEKYFLYQNKWEQLQLFTHH